VLPRRLTQVPPSSKSPWLAWLALAASIAGLAVFLFRPALEVLDTGLDISNYASYAHFTVHHFQYGADVVAMVGPYGFVSYGFLYGGELFWVRLVLELLVKVALAGLIVWHFRHFAGSAWRWVWLAATLVAAVAQPELQYNLCLLLGGFYLLLTFRRAEQRWIHCAVAVFVALVSLTKGTLSIMAWVPLALLLVEAWRAANLRGFVVVALSGLGGFLLFWVLAGQNLLHLPAFLRGVWELASGYGATMGLQEAPATTVLGASIAGLLLLGGACGMWCRRRSVPHLLALVLLGSYSFLAWKHAFVRADGFHIFILPHFACVAAVMQLLLVPAGAAAGVERSVFWLGRLAAVTVLALGLWMGADGGRGLDPWLKSLRRSLANPAYLARAGEAKDRLERELAASRQKYQLPRIAREVGQRRVDFFGYEHGYVALNGLRYAPRPMSGGSFNVYTRYLMQRNETYLGDAATRPDFYLFKYQPTDNRLGAQEDALTLRALLNFYHPVLQEEGVMLLQADPARTSAAVPRPLATVEFAFDQRVDVPVVVSDEILLMSLEIRPTLAGSVRQFLYKPPEISMAISEAGTTRTLARRILPTMIGQPVIFSPLLEGPEDFVRLFTAQPGRTVQSFVLHSNGPGSFQRTVRAKFFTVPRPRARDVAAMLDDFLLWNVEPVAIESPDAGPRRFDGKQILFLHSPGVVTFPLAGSAKSLSFVGGLLPGAYAEGQTDGVDWVVELEEHGQRQTLFRRQLRPLINPQDRGGVTLEVDLPAHTPGSRLIIRADPGPAGNNAWDWAFLARIRIN
jgi:hypothetical protein